MATEALTGPVLKKKISKARQKPLNFAFVPGKKPEDCVMMLHKKRNAKLLGKEARGEGDSKKFAFGSLSINGKVAELTCERYFGQLAKQCKRFLRVNKVSLNVVIMDQDGNEIESDVEELPDDPEFDALSLQDDADDEDQDTADVQDDADDEDQDEQIDPAELVKRLKAVQPAVAAAQGEAGSKLQKVMALAVQQIKSGALDRADQTIEALEGAVGRLGAAPADDNQDDAKDDNAAKPDAKALIARAGDLKQAIASIQGPAREKLVAALGNAAQLIKSGDLGGADTMLTKIEAAVAKTAGTASQQNAASDALPPDAAKWFAAESKLAPLVEKAMQEKKGDLDGINRAFNYARELAADGAFDRALAAAGKVAQLLKEAASATTSAAAQEAKEAIPDNVVPFVQSRLAWIETRNGLRQQIAGLKSAIDSTTSGVEGLEDVSSRSDKLFEYLTGIDTKLEDTLEKLVEAPDGDAREGLKKEARSIIQTYQGVLDTPFFQAVDDNGFVKTDIRGSALASLEKVSEALAS